ncbi:hypothetical protein BC629DRAFT_1552677 [Irpex lacteus]|nr:hypothetical protein BC629DRAFT_1552677 [Irpex lacteus]
MSIDTTTLPFELYECIISYVDDLQENDSWQSTLEACALVSKDFKYMSYRHLFKSVTFVFVQNLDEADVRCFPNDARRRRNKSFHRYVTSIDNIVSYLSESSAIPPCIRRLTLRADHPQMEDSGIDCFYYEEFVEIFEPLKRLHSLSLCGLVIDVLNPDEFRPIYPVLSELSITLGRTFGRTPWTSTTRLYTLCALFGEIGHLVFDFVPWARNSIAEGAIWPPVRSVTIANEILVHSGSPYRILEYLPTHCLCALHLCEVVIDTIASLSRLIEHIGPTLECLTLGEFRLGNGFNREDDELPNTLDSISFHTSLNLHDVALAIDIPPKYYLEPRSYDDPEARTSVCLRKIQCVQRVVFQSLPPSVKTLKLTFLCLHGNSFAALVPQIPVGEFWEVFVQLLDQPVNQGVERIELKMAKGVCSGITVSCNKDEQMLLKSSFPRLADRGVLVFP